MKRYELFQGVYIHTPFCLQKCRYCDFPSYAGFSADVRKRYVAALCREIACRRNPINATSEIGHLTNAKRANEDSNLFALGHAIEGTGTEDVMGNFRLEGEKKGRRNCCRRKRYDLFWGRHTHNAFTNADRVYRALPERKRLVEGTGRSHDRSQSGYGDQG